MAALAIVVVLGLSFILGWLFLLALNTGESAARWDAVEFAALSVTLGVLWLGWVALLLAEAGQFSLPTLAACWIASASVLAFVSRKRLRALPRQTGSGNRREAMLLLVWLCVAGVLYLRPHQFITGAADAGVYVNLGANIAHSGGILIHDPVLAGIDRSLDTVLLREQPDKKPVPYYIYPGFYVPGDPPGLIIPQFYPLHPTWLAVFQSLGGLTGNLLATPWWALLASLAVYLAAREMFGRRAAGLALAGLTVTALQVWFARYPTAEMLTQYLVWMGIFALAAWLSGRQPARLWALVAGASLGEVLLTRLDAYFLVAIPIVLGLWLHWRSQRPGAAAWFFAPFLGLTAHSLVHARLFSWPYFVEIYFNYLYLGMLRRYALPLGAMVLLGSAALLILDRRPAMHAGIVARFRQIRPTALGCTIVALTGLAAYGYWLRPHLGGPIQTVAYWYGGGDIPVNLDRENLVRLGWYLSPWGLALGLGGACLSLWKTQRKTALFVAVGLFYSILYLWRIQANPQQIYTMRRYVPVVLPFATVCAAYLLARLSERPAPWQRWAALAGSLAWLCLLAWSARGFVSQVDFQGIDAELQVLNSRLAPHSILLFDDQAPIGQGDILGTPLRFLYGHDVFSVRQTTGQSNVALAQQVERWRATGRTVYWLTPAAQDAQSAALEGQGTYRVAVQVLESSYENRPQRRIEARWEGNLAQITGPGLAQP